nr:MAG TPA: hypothetical protein [Caudoviricetes sp.]
MRGQDADPLCRQNETRRARPYRRMIAPSIDRPARIFHGAPGGPTEFRSKRGFSLCRQRQARPRSAPSRRNCGPVDKVTPRFPAYLTDLAGSQKSDWEFGKALSPYLPILTGSQNSARQFKNLLTRFSPVMIMAHRYPLNRRSTMASKQTLAVSQESITDLRNQARELEDQIRTVRRVENALAVESDSPARATVVTHLDRAMVEARAAAASINAALDSL